MQKKRNRYEKKTHITACDCVSCCHQCDDDIEIRLIDASVNIAEEQRISLKPNCTTKTFVGPNE